MLKHVASTICRCVRRITPAQIVLLLTRDALLSTEPEEQADARLLDLAMDGLGSDKYTDTI